MRLSTYLKSRGLTYEAFATAIGVSAFAVGKWARGARVPRPDHLRRIRTATDGAVTFDDFSPSPERTPSSGAEP
ncbi:helix-turn-helix domain-containing protein [Pseudochelatococcus lubricantis]|uniref:helix-turn-helix domain-containing protein n=1 Tax=Pseudochelatococcus lubricantis TaxID=1538102 RepID=UPI00141FA414